MCAYISLRIIYILDIYISLKITNLLKIKNIFIISNKK